MGCDQAQRSINTTFLQTKLQKDLHFRLFCNGDVNALFIFVFFCEIIHYSLLARSVFSQIGQRVTWMQAGFFFFPVCLLKLKPTAGTGSHEVEFSTSV